MIFKILLLAAKIFTFTLLGTTATMTAAYFFYSTVLFLYSLSPGITGQALDFIFILAIASLVGSSLIVLTERG